MKTRTKGNKYELEVQKILEQYGYVCHRAYPSSYRVGSKIFARSNDILGCFDIIAKKKDSPTLWIQVSTGPRKSEKQKKIGLLGNIFNPYDKVLLWLRFNGSIFKIYELIGKKFHQVGKVERGKLFSVNGYDIFNGKKIKQKGTK
jgi:hypothetical protein